MYQSILPYLVQQLIYQSPLLLVCVIGAFLSLAYRHIGTPAILLLIGCVLLLLTAVTGAAAQSYLIEHYSEGWGRYGFMSTGILIAVGKATGIAFIICAALAGRGQSLK